MSDMDDILQAFIEEGREFLQGIGQALMALEDHPGDAAQMNDLFRLVHTLKGNSGLFDLPEMTRVLHAGEDLMDAVRDARVPFTRELADHLLDAMDFVSNLFDEIDSQGQLSSRHTERSAHLSAALRALLQASTAQQPQPSANAPAAQPAPPPPAVHAAPQADASAQSSPSAAGESGPAAQADAPGAHARDAAPSAATAAPAAWPSGGALAQPAWPALPDLPLDEAARLSAWRTAQTTGVLWQVVYAPDAECFFAGEDPLHQVLTTPALVWARARPTNVWPALASLDAFRCQVQFDALVCAPATALDEHFRYTPEQVAWRSVPLHHLICPIGHPNGGPVYGDFVAEALGHLDAGDWQGLRQAIDVMAELSAPTLWLSSALRWMRALLDAPAPDAAVLRTLIGALHTLTPPDWAAFDAARQPSTGAAQGLQIAAPFVPVTPVQLAQDAPETVASQTPESRPAARPEQVVAPSAAPPAPEQPPIQPSTLPPAPAQVSAQPRSTPPALSQTQRVWLERVLAVQREVLQHPASDAWHAGRVQAVRATLQALLATQGRDPQLVAPQSSPEALIAWLQDHLPAAQGDAAAAPASPPQESAPAAQAVAAAASSSPAAALAAGVRPESLAQNQAVSHVPLAQAATNSVAILAPAAAGSGAAALPALGANAAPEADEPRSGRRADDHAATKVLKVEQGKVDRLMNLIGEMVVAKNGLPYLAQRAEAQYGVRELSREIKSQYGVINRIAEEMQDAIMAVRMMPVSGVLQRFPRLVRDLSRKLGKEVALVLEGEDTEADKNIIEALADPLIHIVRNSLDHGLEIPAERSAAGKSAQGRLHIRAAQEGDHVVIEINDDGRGIDPARIKRKAYEKGLIDEAQLDRLSDTEAIQLVFAPGFSTAETVSDLSGRGVGMDVVRSALNRVGGQVQLASTLGRGTRLRLTLPLSMAVTNVMIIETDQQIFGIPMEGVVETVRLHQGAMRQIKNQRAAVLRGRIVPLVALNELLAIAAPPKPNAEGELAVLIVRVGADAVGLLVDAFREVVDVILKPLPGELGKLGCYAGSALLGDGSVLMVLNPKELF